MKIIEVILTDSRATKVNIETDNLPLIDASIHAPMAPTAADSVGVATPANIEPSTRKIKINGGAITEKIDLDGISVIFRII